VRLAFSVGTLDRDVWRLTEPGTPPPDRRLAALRRLSDAGLHCSVLVAPVIPGLSDGDEQVRAVVAASRDAGARSVSVVALHLRPGVREHYLGWLARARPELLELHEERFGGRSEQPKQRREHLAALATPAAARRPAARAARSGPAGAGSSDALPPFRRLARPPAARAADAVHSGPPGEAPAEQLGLFELGRA